VQLLFAARAGLANFDPRRWKGFAGVGIVAGLIHAAKVMALLP
jgi:hypothetical protein